MRQESNQLQKVTFVVTFYSRNEDRLYNFDFQNNLLYSLSFRNERRAETGDLGNHIDFGQRIESAFSNANWGYTS